MEHPRRAIRLAGFGFSLMLAACAAPEPMMVYGNRFYAPLKQSVVVIGADVYASNRWPADLQHGVVLSFSNTFASCTSYSIVDLDKRRLTRSCLRGRERERVEADQVVNLDDAQLDAIVGEVNQLWNYERKSTDAIVMEPTDSFFETTLYDGNIMRRLAGSYQITGRLRTILGNIPSQENAAP